MLRCRAMCFGRFVLCLVSLLAAWPIASDAAPTLDPNSYELHPALEMTPWAVEPAVIDPVALCFDARGRAYVVEMRDYPLGIGPDHRQGGTIRLLEDTNQDGYPDKDALFARDLSFPTSITAWREGVLVTAPPQILWLADTNHDGRSDVREVVIDGFKLGVTDSNMNGLRFGLDNHIHGVNGGNGGRVTSPKRPGDLIELGDSDFKFNPDTGEIATTYKTSGGFGLVFDEWGRSFSTYNISHIQQRILRLTDVQRHKGFPPVPLTASISDHEEMSVIFPISAPQTRPNHPEQSGRFSSAGGLGFIASPAFPPGLRGSILVGDVVGNLVHRDLLVPDGPIFRATRAPEEQAREFFASRDPAFRPVGVELGPDGAMYLLDMQRAVIEHPDYIPEKLKAKLNLRAGDDRGRVYRITPKGNLQPARVDLQHARPEVLVATLAHSNMWWRLTAQRLLIERQSKEIIPALQDLAGKSALRRQSDGQQRSATEASTDLAQLHALWTLDGLNALTELDVRTILQAGLPGLRENAAQLAAKFLPGSPELRKALLNLAFDPEPRVRFVAAPAIGLLGGPDALSGLHEILRSGHEYLWMRLAVWASIGEELSELPTRLFEDRNWRQAEGSRLEAWRELGELIGARATATDRGVDSLLTRLTTDLPEQTRWVIAEGVAEGLRRSGARPPLSASARNSLEALLSSANPSAIHSAWRLTQALNLPETDGQIQAIEAAVHGATNRDRTLDSRLNDLRLLELADPARARPILLGLLDGSESSELQVAALTGLGHHTDPAVGAGIAKRWRSLTPAARTRALQLLLDRRPFHEPLVAAIESGQVSVGELNLDLEQRRRLLRESSQDIHARAAKFFGDEEYSNRKAIVETWLAQLPERGDAVKGRQVFEQACASCHVASGLGSRVGPDLSAVAHRSVEDLLSNTLDPNMAINPTFVAYTAETKSGEILSGLLQSNSGDTIILIQAQGQRAVVPRKDLVRLESSGASLMPEGLEAGRTPADLRDLIAFLQEAR